MLWLFILVFCTPVECRLLHDGPTHLGPVLSCLDVPAVAMATGFLQFVYESADMRVPFCCHLFLLRLPNFSLSCVLQSAFVRPFTPDTNVMYLTLYEDNTDMHLSVYLSLFVNEVPFKMCAHA